jgi:preprotein translocase subunit SecG
MKKITVILGTLAILIALAFFACNSGKGESKNKEGITEKK